MRKRSPDYRLPHETYMMTLWYIRTYPRLKTQYDAVFAESPIQDGQPKSPMPSDPTFAAVVKLDRLHDQMRPIEDGLAMIPAEYQKGVFDNIVYRRPYPIIASRNTWERWRRRYVYRVAVLSGRYFE